MKNTLLKVQIFVKNITHLITSGPFVLITFIGNGIIFSMAHVFYLLEFEKNHLINEYIDALWWAFTTVTTVGYGDIVPVTVPGKVLGIFSMLIGTAIFAAYTALFAQALIGTSRISLRKIQHQEVTNHMLLRAMDKHINALTEQIQDLKIQVEDNEKDIEEIKESDS
jgi:voltage-gated potassium channel